MWSPEECLFMNVLMLDGNNHCFSPRHRAAWYTCILPPNKAPCENVQPFLEAPIGEQAFQIC